MSVAFYANLCPGWREGQLIACHVPLLASIQELVEVFSHMSMQLMNK